MARAIGGRTGASRKQNTQNQRNGEVNTDTATTKARYDPPFMSSLLVLRSPLPSDWEIGSQTMKLDIQQAYTYAFAAWT
jgi:hypothetical protein